MVLHGLDLDGAEAGGIPDRRARHAGEDHRAHDVDVGEPAAHPAHRRDGEIVDAVGDAGRVHQVAGQDEERHRQQREAVDAAHHAVQDHEVGDAGQKVRIEQRRGRQCDEHRHPHDEDQQEDGDCNRHASGLFGSSMRPAVKAACAELQPSRALRQARCSCRATIRKQPTATAA
jgi:hypothetical protein